MNTNSNSYTIIYASVMVIIVAFLLAFVSSSLKERQDTNVKLDKMKQILSSLNISEDELKQDAEAAYNKKDADLQQVPLYVCKVNGETKYVAPLYGAGLWGPIWGYISFNSDKKTVYGTYFSNEGETPGLGAEITTESFQSSFEGKQLQEGGEVKISVVKNGKVANSSCEVDGISGGTITSKGVDAMLHDCLKRYANFFNK